MRAVRIALATACVAIPLLCVLAWCLAGRWSW